MSYRLEMKTDLAFIKGELQVVRAEVAKSITSFRAEIVQVRLSVMLRTDFPPGWTKLKLCSTAIELKDKINGLNKKCEDVEYM